LHTKVPKQILGVALVTAICLVGDSMLYITLPVLWGDVGLKSVWQVGVLLSLNRFIRLPANPLVGIVYQKIPLRTGLFLAVSAAAISTIGYGIADSFVVWILLRSLWGIGWSFLQIGSYLVVVEFSEDASRGKAMGTYNGLYRLGSLFGMTAGPFLVHWFGLEKTSIFLGLLSLSLGIILVTVLLPRLDSARGEVMTKREQAWPILIKENFLIVASGFIIGTCFRGVINSSLSYTILTYFTDQIVLFGLAFTAAGLAGLLLGLRWAWEPFLAVYMGHWSDTAGRIPLLKLSLLVGSMGFTLLAFSLPKEIWILSVLVLLFSATSLTTLADTLLSDSAATLSAPRAYLVATYSMAADFGAAVGPMLAYFLLDKPQGIMLTYLSCALVLAALIPAWSKVRRRWGTPFFQG